MVRSLTTVALAGWLVVGFAAPAHADLTGFLGTTTTPSSRHAAGVSFGVTLVIVGFEGEYSATAEDDAAGSPALKTGSGNILLQVPFLAVQPYFTAGAGVYHETLGGNSSTGAASNIGVGVKIRVAGPLRVRLDYRTFKLSSGARYSQVNRFYAGLNLAF